MSSQGRKLSATCVRVLELIAQGYSYEQIVKTAPDLTYRDIFDAAREALDIWNAADSDSVRLDNFVDESRAHPAPDEQPHSTKDDRYAEIRKTYQRAYEPWKPEEDEELARLVASGINTKEICRQLQRNPGAIRSRIKKLGLKDSPKADRHQHNPRAPSTPVDDNWNAEDDEKLLALVGTKKRLTDIATRLQRNPASVRRRIEELRGRQRSEDHERHADEIPDNKSTRYGVFWTKEEDQQMITWFEAGIGEREIARRFQRTRGSISFRIGKIRNEQLGETRVIGKHPGNGVPIIILVGKHGPYLRHKQHTVSIPHNIHPRNITLEQAVTLLNKALQDT